MGDNPLLRSVEEQGVAADATELDLADYCSRPACRRQFQQSTGRGRRREFCSDLCRRLADKEYKQAKAMVDHFERLARRQRHSVLAFGRTADEADDLDLSQEVAIARAQAALDRAQAILKFSEGRDALLVAELEALHDGVRPLIRRQEVG